MAISGLPRPQHRLYPFITTPLVLLPRQLRHRLPDPLHRRQQRQQHTDQSPTLTIKRPRGGEEEEAEDALVELEGVVTARP